MGRGFADSVGAWGLIVERRWLQFSGDGHQTKVPQALDIPYLRSSSPQRRQSEPVDATSFEDIDIAINCSGKP